MKPTRGHRRKYKRVRIGAPVTLVVENEAMDGQLLDVSRTGAHLSAVEPVFARGGTGVMIDDRGVTRPFEVRWPGKLRSHAASAVGLLSETAGVKFSDAISDEEVVALGLRAGFDAARPRFVSFDLRSIRAVGLRLVVSEIWGPAVELAEPVVNIIERMVNAGATHAIIDQRYRDPGYAEEFLSLYHDIHNQSLICKRVFFLKSSDSGSSDRRRKGLLGAMTLRPTGLQNEYSLYGQLGSAWISPCIIAGPQEDTLSYHGMWSNFPVFSNGRKRSVHCFPFVQQDSFGSRCSHVAVHLVSEYLHRHLGLKRLSLSEIRRLTDARSGVSYPIDGLNPRSIVRALAGSGCSPITYVRERGDANRVGIPVPDSWYDAADQSCHFEQLLEVLHVYLDSQLPLILGLCFGEETHHAVCAVGHTIAKKPRRRPAEGEITREAGADSCGSFTDHIRDIIVHNDQVGPYLLLPVDEADEYKSDGTAIQFDTYWNASLERHLALIVAPVPVGVHLPALVALAKSRAAVFSAVADYKQAVNELHGQQGLRWREVKMCAEALRTKSAVTNFYLDLGKRALECILSIGDAVCEDNRLDVICIDWPQYVWVLEFSTDELASEPFDGERILGFLVLDATTPWASGAPLLMKLPGVLTVFADSKQTLSSNRNLPDGHCCFSMLGVENYRKTGWSSPDRGKE